MHGAGNDYIYVRDNLLDAVDEYEEAIKTFDIPSDGLVLIGRSPMPEADFTMRIFNADGSEAMMCGNACRCIGKYLYEKELTDKTEIRLLTLSGIKVLKLKLTSTNIVETVTVDMGEPAFDSPLFKPLPQGGEALAANLPSPRRGVGGEALDSLFVSMGNPHYVIFTDDVDAVEQEGRMLENHPAFPQRCNIEFAEMRPDGIRVRVWERGSGITLACGTGACAVAVAASATGRAEGKCRILMDGGMLDVEWRHQDNHVYLTGPAEFVFEGEIELL